MYMYVYIIKKRKVSITQLIECYKSETSFSPKFLKISLISLCP